MQIIATSSPYSCNTSQYDTVTVGNGTYTSISLVYGYKCFFNIEQSLDGNYAYNVTIF